MSEVKPFKDYMLAHVEQVKTVQALLCVKLSDNPSALEEQLRCAEAWYGRMTSILAWANSYLDLAEKHCLQPRSKDLTDEDRRVALAAECDSERRFRDVVQGLLDGLDKRLMLGMSLMKAQLQERR